MKIESLMCVKCLAHSYCCLRINCCYYYYPRVCSLWEHQKVKLVCTLALQEGA